MLSIHIMIVLANACPDGKLKVYQKAQDGEIQTSRLFDNPEFS